MSWISHVTRRCDEYGTCCLGASELGVTNCTCWTPIYDQPQAPPAVHAAPPKVREGGCCKTCGIVDGLDDVLDISGAAAEGRPFYCHQGYRRAVAWTHPDGRRKDADQHAYEPGYHRGVPLKADGTTADLCAAWAKWAREAGHDWFERGEWPPSRFLGGAMPGKESWQREMEPLGDEP